MRHPEQPESYFSSACNCHGGISRRDFVEIIGLGTAALSAGHVAQGGESRAQSPGKAISVEEKAGLVACGEPCVYREKHLEAISLPVGGIGAGLIQMNGKAEPAIWQIFDNHSNVRVPSSFLAIRVRT